MSKRGRCPNGEALSAYLDRETESPWNHIIGRHVEGCPSCRQALERLRRLRELMVGDSEPSPQLSFESLAGWKAFAPQPRSPFWRRRIALSLPALAAMALAIAGLGITLGFLAARSDLRRMSIRRGPSGTTHVEVAAPLRDLQALLSSLDRQAPSQEITITLPAGSQLIMVGKPQLLRETDFTKVRR